MEKRGKETPLSDRPKLDEIDSYYLNIIMQLRKLTSPITLQDIASYCSMFPVADKGRLLEVVARVNFKEKPSA